MKSLLFTLLAMPLALNAATDKLRIVWQENPESEAKIIWNQDSGKDPILHYGKLDHGLDANAYSHSQEPTEVLDYAGMENTTAKITGLEADTNYYFLIKDSEGVSERYFFVLLQRLKKPLHSFRVVTRAIIQKSVKTGIVWSRSYVPCLCHLVEI